jgi:hypothetical protein
MAARLASSKSAIVFGVIELALVVLAATMSALVPSNNAGAATVPVGFAFFAVGLIVAYRRPHHRMGWILLGCSWFLVLSWLGGTYSVLDYRLHHGRLPLGPVAVLIGPSWAPAIALLALSVVLYPEGQLPSPRWRWPVRWLVGIAAAWQLGAFAIAINAIVGGTIRVASGGDLARIDNPTGAWAWWGVVQDAFFLTLFLVLIAWIVSQAIAYRRLEGERRIQQKWLIGGATLGAVSGLVALIPGLFTSNSSSGTVSDLALVGLCAIPVAIGMGILKFRLYDIDRVISRTLSYAILTALLVGTFVGLVALTTDLLPFSSTVGVAASTLVAFALFNPLRRRVQRSVDRRFNRARYDAETMVAAFAARLRDAVDLDAVQLELLDTVKSAVEPTHATIWIRPHAHQTQDGVLR